MMLRQIFTGCGLFLAGATAAHATLINGNSLQDQLDARTSDGSFLDVNDEQSPRDELWTLSSMNTGTAMIMFELAGFANQNEMGLYDPLNPSNTMPLFSGSHDAGTKISLSENPTSPGMLATCVVTWPSCTDTGDAITLSSDKFGFYLDTPDERRFYSEAALNSDAAADGTTDHLVAFAGDGSESLDPLNTGTYGPFSGGEFVLAWEDKPLTGADRDYNDMVVLTESIIPVPEPAPLALLGMGLLGLVGARRFSQARAG